MGDAAGDLFAANDAERDQLSDVAARGDFRLADHAAQGRQGREAGADSVMRQAFDEPECVSERGGNVRRGVDLGEGCGCAVDAMR